MQNDKKTIYIIFTIAAFFLSYLSLGWKLPPGKLLSKNVFNKSKTDTVWIFNGKDLSNLKLISTDKNISPRKLYKIKNRTIYFNAGYLGYYRTKRIYSSYKLHAEWMWPDKSEKGNSGILVDIQPPDTVWPECIQINFKEDHAGDLIAMNGAQFREAIGKPNTTALILKKSSEKPKGMWNSCDIISRGDSLLVYVNHVLQNKATKIKVHKGMIGWQLETKPIALRNVYLIEK